MKTLRHLAKWGGAYIGGAILYYATFWAIPIAGGIGVLGAVAMHFLAGVIIWAGWALSN